MTMVSFKRLLAALRGRTGLFLTLPAIALASPAAAEPDDLAKQLSNPIAALISVPIQLNYDSSIGAANGSRATANIQPVVPISLNSDWNVISRTIVPITWQDNIAPGSGNQFGLGDITQSAWLSPTKPTSGGLVWGVGPADLLPTATDPLLGSGKWGAGPTAIVLVQPGPWTFGLLTNHIWSFAGDSSRGNISSTFIQPVIAYNTPDKWTFTLNTETTYDWIAGTWTVPINGQISKLVKFGDQPVSRLRQAVAPRPPCLGTAPVSRQGRS